MATLCMLKYYLNGSNWGYTHYNLGLIHLMPEIIKITIQKNGYNADLLELVFLFEYNLACQEY